MTVLLREKAWADSRGSWRGSGHLQRGWALGHGSGRPEPHELRALPAWAPRGLQVWGSVVSAVWRWGSLFEGPPCLVGSKGKPEGKPTPF